MIKKIIKILLIIFLILISIILYLSIFGLKTDQFNNQINNNVLKINKEINISLSEVNYLLNPYNFSINVKTKNAQILFEGRNFAIREIQTNIPIKSLINNQFLIDDLKIKTKEIKLKDIIGLVKSFQNSPQLFIIDKFIKDGLVATNINLNFDEKGKIKNYKIEGSVIKAKLNILNQIKLNKLNFNFNINNNIYSLKKINTKLNNIEITSPFIEIKKKKDFFVVNGQFLNQKKNYDIKEFKTIFANLLNNIDLRKIEFSSTNNFSFNINKKLKFNNLKVESIINLNQLIFNEKNLNLKSYIPSFVEEIKLEEHKIIINYNKNKFDIKGNGNILIEDKIDNLSYQIIKDNNNLLFNSKINLKNNSLLIDFLDYEKKEGSNCLVLIEGAYNQNNQLRFDLLNLKEKNNLNFIIEGESFDASRIINNIMDSNNESPSFFDNLNTKINIDIKKTYIDEVNYINSLNGYVNFTDNKIKDLKLESIFPNLKKINFSIKTNNNLETITRLSSAYPKPLIKRYDFIKGFEEGYLEFYSSKKGGVSNSLLVIDNFKVKEVPIFAKLLSLASFQAIADLLTGEGIRFTDFEMIFSNKKGLTTIEEIYAIGPAVSILMDGYIESKNLVSLRGTLVPATTINRTISSIPFLGDILIGDKTGDGVFGVSFKIKGPPKDLKIIVNPIKTLTPRFITRTLEKIKKN